MPGHHSVWSCARPILFGSHTSSPPKPRDVSSHADPRLLLKQSWTSRGIRSTDGLADLPPTDSRGPLTRPKVSQAEPHACVTRVWGRHVVLAVMPCASLAGAGGGQAEQKSRPGH